MEDWLKYLIAFILGLIIAHMMDEGFSVGGNEDPEYQDSRYPWFATPNGTIKDDKHKKQYKCTCKNGIPATGDLCIAHSSFVPVDNPADGQKKNECVTEAVIDPIIIVPVLATQQGMCGQLDVKYVQVVKKVIMP